MRKLGPAASGRAVLAGMALGLAASACVHAPAPEAATERGQAPLRVLVTGSHIRRPLRPDGSLPLLDAPVVVHRPEELLRTGDPTLAALRRIDPSVQ